MKKITKLAQLEVPQNYDISHAPALPEGIFELGVQSRVDRNTVFLHYGEIAESIWYLHEGTVSGVRYGRSEGTRLGCIINRGFFAETWYFIKCPSLDELVASEDCIVTRFDSPAIAKLLEDKQVINNMLFSLAKKSASMVEKSENANFMTLKERLRMIILNEFKNTDRKDKIEISFSQKELASIMNVHPVSISRVLSELKSEMNIETSKGRITIQYS